MKGSISIIIFTNINHALKSFAKNRMQFYLPKQLILKSVATTIHVIGPQIIVGNVSGNRCESDYRSRGLEYDPCLVPYFNED